MAAVTSPPSAEEGLQLHRRLGEADPTASADLALAYLPHLSAWLRQTNPRLSEEQCLEAAEDAVLALIKDPHSYDPGQQELLVYLRLSARGDLRNLLHREGRHHRGRRDWKSVEHSPQAGKYLGREEDPSFRLRLAEAQTAAQAAIPPALRAGLSEAEGRVLDLMLGGERRTAVYADALDITHLPKAEQKKEVKKVKDRLNKRRQRAGGGHD